MSESTTTIIDNTTGQTRKLEDHETLVRVTVELLSDPTPGDQLIVKAWESAAAISVVDWVDDSLEEAASRACRDAVETINKAMCENYDDDPWTPVEKALPDDDILVIGCNAEMDTQWFVKRVEGRWLDETGVRLSGIITHWRHLDPCPVPVPFTPRND